MANGNTNMSISLPERMKKSIQEVTKTDSYSTPSDYIRDVVREDLKRREEAKIEQMLLDGINSGPAIPMTPQEWQKLRTEIRERANKKKRK